MNIAVRPEVPLGDLMLERGSSTDPIKSPDSTFTLYSIPAFDVERPEILQGSQIGSIKKNVRSGDVLLSRIVPHIRRSWIVGVHPGSDILASSEWIVFRSQRFYGPYLRHFLTSDIFHPRFMQTVAGVGGSLLRASPKQVANITIPLPPLDEQRRIAAILDKADALRRKRRRALDLLDNLTTSLISEYLLDAIDTVELGSLLVEGPTNGLYKPASFYGDGTPILRIDAFYDGKIINLAKLKRLSTTEIERSRFALKDGDIIVNRVNSIEYLGKSALVVGLKEPTVFESNMMRLVVDTNRLLPDVCIALLQTASLKRQILNKAKNAVNQSSINQSDVQSLRIPFPSKRRQLEFSKIAHFVTMERQKAVEACDRSSILFAALQSRAFSGQL